MIDIKSDKIKLKLVGKKRKRVENTQKTKTKLKSHRNKENKRQRISNLEELNPKDREIPVCLEFHATEEDFKNPISYFEKLWLDNKSTGIIKIIPPSSWREKNEKMFSKSYFPKFIASDKILETRIQTLNKLFQGKVFFKLFRNLITSGSTHSRTI